MRRFGFSSMRRFLSEELGQTVVILVVVMSAVMSLAGAAIESAHVYYAYRLLQASTNASALAAASQMPDIGVSSSPISGTAFYSLHQYSSETGKLNATNLLTSDTISANFYCSSSTVSSTLNVGCQTPPTGEGSCTTGSTCNAVTATQTATIPLWFGGLFGFRSLNVSAVATAAMAGGSNTPWNIVIILDSTNSMSQSDGGTQCSSSKIQCALQGVQLLLGDLYPCMLGQTCTNTTGVTPVDSVSLFVFPAITTGSASKDYTCPTSNPTAVAYTIPNASPAYTAGTAPASNLMLPSADTYQVLGFADNYKITDASGLDQAIKIVIAAGDSGVTGCNGIQAPGGEGTYYAQVIYAAQAALASQQTNNPGSKNAMIILSDGDATACASNANTSAGGCNTKSNIVATEGTLNGTGSSTSVVYPSPLGECGQAVLAAQYAANQGTAVYTIGYGSENTGGNASGSNAHCVSDKTYSASVTTNGGAWAPGDSPCQALAAMASTPVNFYSDDGAGCVASSPSNANITKLTNIFHAITNHMTVPRLVPLNAQ